MPGSRQEVLDIAHRGLAGGHFFMKKEHIYAACAECLRGGGAHSKQVPLQKTQLSLYHIPSMACDLVGPLAGSKYILTVMCLGTSTLLPPRNE